MTYSDMCVSAMTSAYVSGKSYHLIDPVVLNKQHALVFVSESLGEFLKHLLLIHGHLLCAVLVAVGTHLPFLLRVKDECEPGWLEGLEDES